MPKKSVKKSGKKARKTKSPRRKTTHNKSEHKHSGRLEDQILQNLINLQKINVNLAEKFESLTGQISSLLKLFEMSARSFGKQSHLQVTEKDKEFLEKIDKLLDQNKTIARGLTLMEEKMRERLYGPGPTVPTRPPVPNPQQRSIPKF